MRIAVAGTVEFILRTQGRKHRESAVHGNYRQAILGCAVVWLTTDGATHAASRSQVRSPPCAPIDAADAIGANLSDTKHQQEASSAQDLPLFVEKVTDHKAQPSLVRGYNIYSNAARFFVFGRDYGLVQPQGFELAIVKQHGSGFLC